MHTFPHALTHAARTAELTAEAAAWRLAREAAPAAPALPALRNRLGEGLIAVGTRLLQPVPAHARVRHQAA
ncbi:MULTISPECIES: hypothetical protein [Streptomyces]|uniref:hypothetical protein n=1 Tax=Streptomyces TaxID=1883 RepID=UPI0013DF9292|nr:hypothetical protein [Streptomyces sp. W1SF4]